MSKIKQSVFYVAAYEKNGHRYLVEDCKLSGIGLDFLRKLFKVNPNDPDIMVRDIVYNLEIKKNEAAVLEQYVSFKFDFRKYNYRLEGRGGYHIPDDEEPPH